MLANDPSWDHVGPRGATPATSAATAPVRRWTNAAALASVLERDLGSGGARSVLFHVVIAPGTAPCLRGH